MLHRVFVRFSFLLAAGLLAACSEQAPTPDPKLIEGEALYKANCKVCHAQGINGAPIVGNQKMWASRASQGAEVLTQHAIEGFGLMPAKGGSTQLSDEQIAIIVGYILSELEGSP